MKLYLLILLILSLFFSACEKAIIYNDADVSLSGNKESKYPLFNVPINKNEWATFQKFIEPYQVIYVSCGKQPCVVELNGKIIYPKLNNGDFRTQFVTVLPEAKNYEKIPLVVVDDHETIYVKLAGDATSDSANAFISIVSLTDSDKREIFKDINDADESFYWGIYKIIFVFIAVLFCFIVLAIYVSFMNKSKEKVLPLKRKAPIPDSPKTAPPKNDADLSKKLSSVFKKLNKNVTPEDILNHVDD